jgi:hypothetical protein
MNGPQSFTVKRASQLTHLPEPILADTIGNSRNQQRLARQTQ